MFKIKFFFLFLLMGLAVVVSAQREKITLDGEWNYCIDSTKAGIQNKWFEKGLPSLKEKVQVPHTWNTIKETAKYHGWDWYQRKIMIPSNWKRKILKLQFDAVYHDTVVWVNGKQAVEHKGAGFTKFSSDVSALIQPGIQTTITVLADNSFAAENMPYRNLFDWANDCGIIRSVSLLSTNRPRIDFIHVLAKPDLTKPAIDGRGFAKINIKLSELSKLDIAQIWQVSNR